MLAKTITSLQHPLVGYWLSLRKERAFRKKEGQVLVTGERLIRELAPDFPLTLLTSSPCSIPAQEHYVVTPGILKKITGLEEPDGFAAVLPLPSPQNLHSCKHLLILDRLADPGNVGTLLRTARALGWEGVVITPGTADLFNDKALRAAKGATFHLPYMESEELDSFSQPLLADLTGTPLDQYPPAPCSLILSSEAHGPRSLSCPRISIPMHPGMESLNVAAAGAILLYALRPR